MAELKYKETSCLQEEEIRIREEIFVKEQGFHDEFDEIDQNPRCRHLVLFCGDELAGCCRYFPGEKNGEWILGRVAILKKFRRRGLASEMVREVECRLQREGEKAILLAAQYYVTDLYQKLGYSFVGDPFFEEHCKHIWMKKEF